MQIELNEVSITQNMMQARHKNPADRANKNLRLIRKDPASLALRKAQGYKVVVDPDESLIETFLPLGPNKTYEFSDVILAECPMELYENRRERAKRKGKAMEMTSKEMFHSDVEKIEGIRSYVPNPNEAEKNPHRIMLEEDD